MEFTFVYEGVFPIIRSESDGDIIVLSPPKELELRDGIYSVETRSALGGNPISMEARFEGHRRTSSKRMVPPLLYLIDFKKTGIFSNVPTHAEFVVRILERKTDGILSKLRPLGDIHE